MQARTWWYVLSGGAGVRQYVARRPVAREQAVDGIVAEVGVGPEEVEQCWPFRKDEDLYHAAWYRR